MYSWLWNNDTRLFLYLVDIPQRAFYGADMMRYFLTSGCSGRSFSSCPAQMDELFSFFLGDSRCKIPGKRPLFIIEGQGS